MGQHKKCRLAVIVVHKEVSQRSIGKVANPAHDPLLDHPGIGAVTQHFQIMVGLNHQTITGTEVLFYIGRHVTQVSDDSNLYAGCLEGKAAWVSRIVGNGKWHYRDARDHKAAT